MQRPACGTDTAPGRRRCLELTRARSAGRTAVPGDAIPYNVCRHAQRSNASPTTSVQRGHTHTCPCGTRSASVHVKACPHLPLQFVIVRVPLPLVCRNFEWQATAEIRTRGVPSAKKADSRPNFGSRRLQICACVPRGQNPRPGVNLALVAAPHCDTEGRASGGRRAKGWLPGQGGNTLKFAVPPKVSAVR